MNRRLFIRNTTFASAATYLSALPLNAISSDEIIHLTILHTNDVHSRIDPFPDDGSRNAGQGGVAKRSALIDQIREQEDHVLLLDAGDMFQGTPYFNMFGGELEIKLMSQLKYDAGTIGNHDFDGGIDGLGKQLVHANFPLVISNYGLGDTVLDGKTKDYKIWNIDGAKIGMYGLGIEMDGLVGKGLYGDAQYHDPIKTALRYEKILKEEKGCDYVICLSHLGYKYKGEKVSDVVIAQSTSMTDLIIGGHTHTFMREPTIEKNTKGEPVMINQVGFAGIYLGRLDIYFEKGSAKKRLLSENIKVK